MTENNDDFVILWEAPIIVPPEFRLYYDDKGKVVCYSCDQLEGNYIVIDALTYAAARPDIRVIDGKISTVPRNMVISKLMPGETGTLCASEDISVIVNDEYVGTTNHWKLNTYELE
jgi:hypothetical protein